jgi:hypothetical protein
MRTVGTACALPVALRAATNGRCYHRLRRKSTRQRGEIRTWPTVVADFVA